MAEIQLRTKETKFLLSWGLPSSGETNKIKREVHAISDSVLGRKNKESCKEGYEVHVEGHTEMRLSHDGIWGKCIPEQGKWDRNVGVGG